MSEKPKPLCRLLTGDPLYDRHEFQKEKFAMLFPDVVRLIEAAETGNMNATLTLMILSAVCVRRFHEVGTRHPAAFAALLSSYNVCPVLISNNEPLSGPRLKAIQSKLGGYGGHADELGEVAWQIVCDITFVIEHYDCPGLRAWLGPRLTNENWERWYQFTRDYLEFEDGPYAECLPKLIKHFVKAPSKRSRAPKAHFFTMLRDKIKSMVGENKT